ncbi:MAG: RNA ligase RtcB family protein [Planctomycetes bacterium]|nr:RNA ligase RtcB family protein [Planctomycetota bacterium]
MDNPCFAALTGDGRVRLLASRKNWIEGEAVSQLRKTAALPGVRLAVGLPDLHPGRGHPVGAAFVTAGLFYPQLVGNDVGCGMSLWQTNLPRQKFRQDRCVKTLRDLESPWDGDPADWLRQYGIEPTEADAGLGTIGGGNHFAEVQDWQEVHEEAAFTDLHLQERALVILVHSGSRGLGELLLQSHLDQRGADGLSAGTEEAALYRRGQERARQWAVANRALIARRMAEQLHCTGERVLDNCHNSITAVEYEGQSGWLHRKGAAPADAGPIVIPGTRGSLSYLVLPTGPQRENAWSLAHGAGRRWNRQSARARLKDKYRADSLVRTEIGNAVICEDKELLYEEAPQAYKNIDVVVNDMVEAGLIRIVATLKPLITYKTKRTNSRS